jgi:hypothetical protein
MKKLSQFAVLALVVAFCFGTLAMAELNKSEAPTTLHHPRIVKSHHGDLKSDTAPAANIYGVWQAFAGTPAIYGLSANSDGSPVWPCFGGGTSSNPDCPTIGDPAQDNYGVEVGVPNYTWEKSACNATSTSTAVCGELETFYEDTTADTTDDLLYSFTAINGTSGTAYIADSGTEDFGPDALGAPASAYPITVIFSGPQNFGTMGQSGANNGNCDPNYQYPIPNAISAGGSSSAPYPVYPFVVAAGKTCVAPAGGVVTLSAITELATPKYTAVKTGEDGFGDACTATIPCYKVAFTKKYSATQKWSIWLE